MVSIITTLHQSPLLTMIIMIYKVALTDVYFCLDMKTSKHTFSVHDEGSRKAILPTPLTASFCLQCPSLKMKSSAFLPLPLSPNPDPCEKS